ncbi:MAG: TRAP transporter small permease [Synergistaceae bacterium]|jgi:TRAP-type C4-dicarboxylate transport system permease small subunit|nr:TRAP transporter small permease [Synergistaceae bacterium]
MSQSTAAPSPDPRRRLRRISDRVNCVCEVALFASIVGMTVVTILQIVSRVWFRALPWSEELTCFLLVAASFLGTAVAFHRGAHIAVTFLLDAMPASLKKLCLGLIACIGMAFFAVLAWYGAVLCWTERGQTATAMTVSMSWVYAILPVTSAIVILHLAAQIDGLVHGLAQKEGGRG